ncbi:hypothetical protein ACFYP6_33485 [Streptomyces goshikiensis]|uniref:hypothetical protein n=1 Tax=Streptomyces goshikiensis TaxID=1942 RepID=UPI0036774F35
MSCSIEFLESGRIESETGAEMDSVWATYVAQHAEAQMSVSDEVLVALGAVNGSLRKMYGLVQGLRRGTLDRESALQELDVRRGELWDRLTAARDEMRKDLGIAPSTWQPDTL